MTQLHGYVEKGWGNEMIWASNEKYCGKLLQFKAGARFSMHFHAIKDETWLVLDGVFQIETIDTSNAKVIQSVLNKGDVQRILPLVPHRITCIQEGTIIEVSTPDSVEDNYRVLPGDSQK